MLFRSSLTLSLVESLGTCERVEQEQPEYSQQWCVVSTMKGIIAGRATQAVSYWERNCWSAALRVPFCWLEQSLSGVSASVCVRGCVCMLVQHCAVGAYLSTRLDEIHCLPNTTSYTRILHCFRSQVGTAPPQVGTTPRYLSYAHSW